MNVASGTRSKARRSTVGASLLANSRVSWYTIRERARSYSGRRATDVR